MEGVYFMVSVICCKFFFVFVFREIICRKVKILLISPKRHTIVKNKSRMCKLYCFLCVILGKRGFKLETSMSPNPNQLLCYPWFNWLYVFFGQVNKFMEVPRLRRRDKENLPINQNLKKNWGLVRKKPIANTHKSLGHNNKGNKIN